MFDKKGGEKRREDVAGEAGGADGAVGISGWKNRRRQRVRRQLMEAAKRAMRGLAEHEAARISDLHLIREHGLTDVEADGGDGVGGVVDRLLLPLGHQGDRA